MAINRNILIRGPAQVNYSGITMFSKTDLNLRLAPTWGPVSTSMFGQVDEFSMDRVFKVPVRLWGAWENLAVIFPSYALAPQYGTDIFGQNATPLTILGRNGDQVQYANAQITKLSNLYLGVDEDLFQADLEFTCVIGNSGSTLHNPEDANAYYTVSTGNAFADGAFTKANYKRVRFTGAFGNAAGFTAFAGQKGFQVAWELDARPFKIDGYGTVTFTIGEKIMVAACKAIPVQNTMAQMEGQAQAQGTQFGTLLSTLGQSLVLTGNGGSPIITLNSVAIKEHGYAFGSEPLRQGEVTWETVRQFNAGAPQPVALVA